MKKLMTALLTVALLISSTAYAATWDDGNGGKGVSAGSSDNGGKWGEAVNAYKNGDYEKAKTLITPFAAQGNAQAQFHLAQMYASARGVPQDFVEAVKYYKLASAQGFAQAQFNLGWLYGEGLGVSLDYVEAVKYYKLASAQGFAQAQFHLGVAYVRGQGVTRDNVSAYMWHNLATEQGYDKAVKNREYIANLLTPQQLAEAQKLSNECLAKKYKGC